MGGGGNPVEGIKMSPWKVQRSAWPKAVPSQDWPVNALVSVTISYHFCTTGRKGLDHGGVKVRTLARNAYLEPSIY